MKIAVLLYGHLRDFENCADSLKENLLSRHDCDVFMHTWDERDHNSKCWHEQRFDAAHVGQETIDIIKSKYNPKGIIVEHQEKYAQEKIIQSPFNKDLKMSSAIPYYMFHTMNQANQLRLDYEKENGITYDFIIVTRPDVQLKTPFEIEKFISQIDVLGLDKDLCRFFCPYEPQWLNEWAQTLINTPNDIFFFATPTVINKYIEANATSKEKAMELIKNLNSENSYLYNESAKKYAESYAGNDEDSEKIREALIAIGEYFKNATNSGKAYQIGTQGKTQEQTTTAQNNLQQGEAKIPEGVSAENWEKITSRATEEDTRRARARRRATLAWQEQQRQQKEEKVLRADGEDGEGDVMKGRTYKISYGNESYDYKLWGTNLFDGVLEYDYWNDEFKEKVRAGSYKNGTVVKGKDSYGVTYFWVLDDLGTSTPRAVKIEARTGEKKKFLERYAIDLGGVF